MKCFYHNDLDGKCSAAVVARFEKNYSSIDYFEVDYRNNLPLDCVANGEKVYIVDYAISKASAWQLDCLINEKNCDIVWIDHHTTSVNLENQAGFTWLSSIGGIRSEEFSGAALTYMYLYSAGIDSIPYAVKLVSDYDRWEFKHDPDTTLFKIGIDCVPHDALDGIWLDLLSDIDEDASGRSPVLLSLLEKGQTIKDYIDIENTYHRNSYAYETMVGGVKCLAINRKSNSWIFGEKYGDYPLVMVYAFDGVLWNFTIYSADTNIDCSKIAESYGGGGHTGAAGFTLDNMPFLKESGS